MTCSVGIIIAVKFQNKKDKKILECENIINEKEGAIFQVKDYLTKEDYNFTESDITYKYNISEKELNILLNNGLLTKYKKWYHFTDFQLNIYLAAMYTNMNDRTNCETYEKIFNLNIMNVYTIYLMEEYATKKFNDYFLKAYLENIIKNKTLEDYIKKFGVIECNKEYNMFTFKSNINIDLVLDLYLKDSFAELIYQHIKKDEDSYNNYKTENEKYIKKE